MQSGNAPGGKLSRRRFLERAVVVGGLLSAGSGLLAACSPAPAPSPTAAKPAGEAAAKPADAAAAKPADAAKPAAQPAAAASPAVGRPTAAGSIVLTTPEEPRTLANWHAYGSPGYPVLRNVEEALLNRDPKTNQLVGELATKWEPTNPTTWRFTLRQGVKFHDGSPFNAESAAFGINHVWDKENAFDIRAFVGPEMTATAVDEYTVDVVTTAPDPILPSRLYFSPFTSMKLVKETPDQYPIKPVGTGPYRFVEWARGQHIKIEVNPDWWGHTASDAYGKATIKDVTFIPRGEQEVRAAMVTTGEADFARWLVANRCQEMPQCVSGPAVETTFVRLDTNHPSLSDIRVREAVALAIDKKSIIETLIGGGTLASQLVGPSALGYNPDLQPIPYDPARATQLIAEAKAAGVPVETPVVVMARGKYIQRVDEIAEAIAASLKQIGLPNVRINLPEAQIFQDIMRQKPVPPDRGMIVIHQHGNELMDYSATFNSYYLSTGVNATFTDPVADEMHKAALPLIGAEREKAYQAISAQVAKNLNIIPIGHPSFFYGLSPRLQWQTRMDGFILLKEMTLKA
jgi:peptide/nickel transport system substrate-binding protein